MTSFPPPRGVDRKQPMHELSVRRSAWRGSEFGLPLGSQPRAGLTLALKIVEGVFERHTVELQKSIELVARRNIKHLAQLVTADPVHSVRINRKCLERRPRQILARVGELRDDIVRKVQGDLHLFQYGTGIGEWGGSVCYRRRVGATGAAPLRAEPHP